jgi:hypothetical protein
VKKKSGPEWLAGFYEGEGSCVYIGTSVQIRIVNTDLETLNRVLDIVGFGTIYKVKPVKQKPHWKQRYDYAVMAHNDVVAFVKKIWPWLCDKRRSQIKTAFSKFQKRPRSRNCISRRKPRTQQRPRRA